VPPSLASTPVPAVAKEPVENAADAPTRKPKKK